MIIDGKKFAKALRSKIKSEIIKIKKSKKPIPSLTVVLVGSYTPSAIYVKNKELSAKEVGINSSVLRFESSISELKLISVIKKLNQNPKGSWNFSSATSSKTHKLKHHY